MSLFSSAVEQVKGSKYIIFLTIVAFFGIIIGCFAMREDYISSLEGYRLLPTRKSGREVVQVIAALPQVGQIIFFYLFSLSVRTLPNGRRRFSVPYFTISTSLFLIDIVTDTFFKASGGPLSVWLIGLLESITVYTIGSEMLLTASIGLFLELAPIAWRQLVDIFAGFMDMGGDDDESDVGGRAGGRRGPSASADFSR